MALRINLYHEIQRQETQRRRDPLKLGFYAMGFIALGFVAYYFARLNSSHATDMQLGALRTEWAKLEPKAKAAKVREEELTTEIKTCDALVKRIEARSYWAPVLDGLVRSVPREVQVLKLAGELSIDAGKTDAISITGISSSPAPRTVAEALRKTLNEQLGEKFKHVTSSFKTLEDGEEAVMPDGRRSPVANFTLDFLLNPPGAAPAAVPAPARRPKS